jgi:SNF2 family DNA or RNA helicase
MYLGPQRWQYVVLDEGHVLRNATSRAALAAKRLCAQHRCAPRAFSARLRFAAL